VRHHMENQPLSTSLLQYRVYKEDAERPR